MTFSLEDQKALVVEANKAPSVHNTQPTRWSFEDNKITLWIEPKAILKVGDPKLQDASVSLGATCEGTAIHLSRHGFDVDKLFTHPLPSNLAESSSLIRAAELHTVSKERQVTDDLAPYVNDRYTWRGLFDPASKKQVDALDEWCATNEHVHLTHEDDSLAFLAELNDEASLRFFSDRAYRDELVSYMRLSQNHPLWGKDGLNLDAMQMSALEGLAAGIVLKHPFFEGLSSIGLAKMLVSEREKTLSASGVIFFSTPGKMSRFETGRLFYRTWLHFSRLGFSAWPMAVLADDEKAARLCCNQFDIPQDHTLITVFRMGNTPAEKRPKPARLSAADLIITP